MTEVPESKYTFADVETARELERLRRIEQVFDPGSRRRLEVAGIARGFRCLEVGAGAGSIAAWMAECVGAEGEVVAVDLNVQFLDAARMPGVRIVEGDLREIELVPEQFDAVHARYVLVHNPDYGKLLEVMLRVLRPGGCLILEEPDFTAARGVQGADLNAFDRVNRAIVAMFEAGGKDPGLGLKLPAALADRGLVLELVENEVPLCRGGHPVADVMSRSAIQLREKYLATGCIDEADLAGYARFAADPSAWGIYYGTVGVIARKPRVLSG
ncbi:MAG: methyltransferase domain-containing protein [Pseudomonadota bacterium]